MLHVGAAHRTAWLQLVEQHLGAIGADALMPARDEDVRLGAIHANDALGGLRSVRLRRFSRR